MIADQVYVSGLSQDVTEEDLAAHFGSIGMLKDDKKRGKPKIWLYRDKATNALKASTLIYSSDRLKIRRYPLSQIASQRNPVPQWVALWSMQHICWQPYDYAYAYASLTSILGKCEPWRQIFDYIDNWPWQSLYILADDPSMLENLWESNLPLQSPSTMANATHTVMSDAAKNDKIECLAGRWYCVLCRSLLSCVCCWMVQWEGVQRSFHLKIGGTNLCFM